MDDNNNWIFQELQDVLSLLRTGTSPTAWGMSQSEWTRYKCDKAAGKLQSIMDRLNQAENEI